MSAAAQTRKRLEGWVASRKGDFKEYVEYRAFHRFPGERGQYNSHVTRDPELLQRWVEGFAATGAIYIIVRRTIHISEWVNVNDEFPPKSPQTSLLQPPAPKGSK